jgi:DNA-directed RNA polymerase subunit RPC12/RpoP
MNRRTKGTRYVCKHCGRIIRQTNDGKDKIIQVGLCKHCKNGGKNGRKSRSL